MEENLNNENERQEEVNTSQESSSDDLGSIFADKIREINATPEAEPEKPKGFQSETFLEKIGAEVDDNGEIVKKQEVEQEEEGEQEQQEIAPEVQSLYDKAQEDLDSLTDEEYQILVDNDLAEPELDLSKGIDQTQDVELTEEDLVGVLQTELGLEISSLEDIKSVIDDYRNKSSEYENRLNTYQELSEEEKAMIMAGRKHGDYGLYNFVSGLELDGMSNKDVLKAKYLLENKGDKQFLSEKFEREYNNRFEDAEDEDWAKRELEQESRDAKNFLKNYKDELQSLSGELAVDKPEGKSEEEIAEEKAQRDQQWFDLVDSTLEEFNSVIFEVEGVDGSELNIELDEADMDSIKEIMDNPINYVGSQLVDENGQVNKENLFMFAMREKYLDKLVREAYELGKVATEEQIMDERKNVEQPKSKGKPKPNVDVREQIASNWFNGL